MHNSGNVEISWFTLSEKSKTKIINKQSIAMLDASKRKMETLEGKYPSLFQNISVKNLFNYLNKFCMKFELQYEIGHICLRFTNSIVWIPWEFQSRVIRRISFLTAPAFLKKWWLVVFIFVSIWQFL